MSSQISRFTTWLIRHDGRTNTSNTHMCVCVWCVYYQYTDCHRRLHHIAIYTTLYNKTIISGTLTNVYFLRERNQYNIIQTASPLASTEKKNMRNLTKLQRLLFDSRERAQMSTKHPLCCCVWHRTQTCIHTQTHTNTQINETFICGKKTCASYIFCGRLSAFLVCVAL